MSVDGPAGLLKNAEDELNLKNLSISFPDNHLLEGFIKHLGFKQELPCAIRNVFDSVMMHKKSTFSVLYLQVAAAPSPFLFNCMSGLLGRGPKRCALPLKAIEEGLLYTATTPLPIEVAHVSPGPRNNRPAGEYASNFTLRPSRSVRIGRFVSEPAAGSDTRIDF